MSVVIWDFCWVMKLAKIFGKKLKLLSRTEKHRLLTRNMLYKILKLCSFKQWTLDLKLGSKVVTHSQCLITLLHIWFHYWSNLCCFMCICCDVHMLIDFIWKYKFSKVDILPKLINPTPFLFELRRKMICFEWILATYKDNFYTLRMVEQGETSLKWISDVTDLRTYSPSKMIWKMSTGNLCRYVR